MMKKEGSLDVVLINSFIPDIGYSFQVLNYTSSIGSLNTNLPTLPSDRIWSTNTGSTSLTLSVISSGGGEGRGGGGGGGEEPTCEYSISSKEETFTSEGGAGSVDISTDAGCEWTAASNDNWIKITSDTSGSGDGTVEYSVSVNTISKERTGTLTIAGETFDVIQDGDTGDTGGGGECAYSLSSTGGSFTADSGTGSLNVTTDDGGVWTAVKNGSWITITSGSSGTGSGTVEFSVLENTGIDLRTSDITITGDGYTETFTVTQEALSPDIKANKTERYRLYYGYSSGEYSGKVDLADSNGLDGPTTIGTDGNLSIEISLSTSNHVGKDADWWFVAKTPSGWESYDLAKGFVPGIAVTDQNEIYDFGPYTIFDTSGLGEGKYVYYFGIDLYMDGDLDEDEGILYYDSVEVTVEEGAGLSTPTGFTASADGTTVTLNGDDVYEMVFENIPEDTYYLAITAYADTEESGYSDEVSVTVQ